MKDTSTTTVVAEKDIQQLPTSGRILLRLHRQTNISNSSTYLYPTITINTIAGTKTLPSSELHHIELVTSCTKAY
ncbi:hypothetical protein BGZ75_000936, partial [Mortierella antarctica]